MAPRFTYMYVGETFKYRLVWNYKAQAFVVVHLACQTRTADTSNEGFWRSEIAWFPTKKL